MGKETALLTFQYRHVQPDFHGNRSPLANLWERVQWSFRLNIPDIDDLALITLQRVQALAYGNTSIIEEMPISRWVIDTLVNEWWF